MALLFFVNGVVVGSWLPRLPEIGTGLESISALRSGLRSSGSSLVGSS